MRIKLNIQRFANSGQCVTSTNSDGSYFYVNWQQASQDITNNKTTINYQYGVHCGVSYQYNAVRIDYVNINGRQVKGSQTWSNKSRGDHELGNGSMEIEHNPDGTKTFNINLSGWTWGTTTVTGTKDFTLNSIPRYTSVTQWSVTSVTETSATLTWKTADTCSAIRYGKGTTSGNYTETTVNTNTGSVTITGLTAGQNNTVYFMPKRKDSSLWGNGSANVWKDTTAKPYDYPKLDTNGGPDFFIESPVTLTIYNPMGKQCTVTVYDKNGNEIGSTTTNNTVAGPFLDDNTSTLRMYSSIPNDPSGRYSVKVDTTSHTGTAISGGLYKANPDLCNPIFEDYTIADVDEDTRALTGNNHYQIVGYSDMAAIIHSEDKAVAQHGATMAYYRFIIGNNPPVDEPYSENLDVSAVVDNAPAGAFYVYAFDSRGLYTLIPPRYPERVIDYVDIARGQISIARQNSVGEQVTLTFNGTFWNDKFGTTGAVDNSITNVRYRYKKTTESWGDTWNGETSIVPTTTIGSNDFSFTGSIKGDTNAGFNVSYSYNIEIEVSDQLSKTIFSVILGSGVPNLAIAKEGVAINGQYDTSDNGVLQVNGKTSLKGNTNVTGNMVATGNVEGGSLFGRPWDFNTENTTDTWVPVASGGSWKHRILPQIDTTTSTTSTNLITNKAITTYINNLFAGAIKRNQVDVNTGPAWGTSVTATVPSGYTFLCWLTPSSYGTVNSAYMEDYWKQSTKIWQTTNNNNQASFHCGYLMIKTDLLG